MANALGTQARYVIFSPSQGTVRLRRMFDAKVKDGATTEAVNAIGEDDPVGFRDKPGAKTITLSIYEEQGKPEVDYRKMKAAKEYFSMTREIVNGKKLQYPVCRISTIEPSDDNEGKHTFDVEIVALSEKEL